MYRLRNIMIVVIVPAIINIITVGLFKVPSELGVCMQIVMYGIFSSLFLKNRPKENIKK